MSLISVLIPADTSEDELFKLFSSQDYFSASFIQKNYFKGKHRIVLGNIFADRKGRFRLVYQEPFKEEIISDGTNLYIFDEELEQVEIRSLEKILEETPIGLLSLNSSNLTKFFELEKCVEQNLNFNCSLNVLTKDSYIQNIELIFKDGILSSLNYNDSFEQNVSIEFSDISLTKIENKKFIFTPPEGIDIVRTKKVLE